MSLAIRPETPADQKAIHTLTELAFRDRPYASGDEQDIVDRLRDSGALSISLVAVIGERLVGHIAFSPAISSDGNDAWFTLGPVSVHPAEQRKGIGAELIRRGLDALQARQAQGCILVGDPAYYRRFEFEVSPSHSPDPAFAEYFMVRAFADAEPVGRFEFDPAFNARK